MAAETVQKQEAQAISDAVEYGGDISKTTTVLDGTTQMYDGGCLRLIPAPSSHRDDPLNFSTLRKVLAIASLCFFGAIAIAMQQMISGLIPVFMLVYAGLDPHLLDNGGLGAYLANLTMSGGGASGGYPSSGGYPTTGGIVAGAVSLATSATAAAYSYPTDASTSGYPSSGTGGYPSSGTGDSSSSGSSANLLEILSMLPGAQPLDRVNLLVSLPVLLVGVSNYILVPASIAFGRRAVMIFCVVLATLCTAWAGLSTSLNSHIAARCLQAIGTGAVESLIPLIVQDMTFVHQRSRGIGLVWASQAIVSISLGIGSTYIVSNISWRWLYYIGAIITGVSAMCVIAFVPETRWHRTPEALRGEPSIDDMDAAAAAASAGITREGPSAKVRYGLFANGGISFRDGAVAFVEIVKTLVLPIVFYCILVNAVFIGVSLGSSATMSSVLLAAPYNWSISAIGLSVIAPSISSIFVMIVGGWLADVVVKRLAKKNGGKREAEMNLWNLIFPLFCGVFGCLLFGAGGQYVEKLSWMAILAATSILTFAFLTTNVIASVTVVESYPRLAGPVLVNVASFRNIIAFGFTYGIPIWVAKDGYMTIFSIFAGLIAFLSLFLPVFFIFGKRLRKSTGFVNSSIGYSL
ncbi:hypothetical protein SBRCBS47491_002671 [Sporothrix bragantina]|uniref:Major facilitator superfamily (MFS) profile domain-containing protein n=1 Tax=Sporothrix bragantina TaxID=671064 RepID=A0ABP0B8N2_9PEZI